MSIELKMPSNHPNLTPFSSCLQSFPALESFPMSRLFTSGGQRIGVSASASVLPKNIQDWFPLGLAGLIFLQSKGPSRVFSRTTVQKHQFFDSQPSLWSKSHICIWLLEKTVALNIQTFVSKVIFLLFNMLSNFVIAFLLRSYCCCCCITSFMSDSVRPHRWQPTRLLCPWDSPGKNTGVGCHCLLQCMKVKSESEVAQSCWTLATPWTAA